MIDNAGVNLVQARSFLADRFQIDPTQVTLLGEGAWSRCFGFHQGKKELVIRFGNHVDDFEKDQVAHRYAAPDLPIPQVTEIGEAFDGYYAISTRAHGVVLEQVSTEAWRALVPAVVAALEAMRTADITDTSGFGGWGVDRNGSVASWSARLLSVDTDVPAMRTHGWRAKLATLPEGDSAFRWGYELLKQVARDDVPRCLLHCDLINRNVLVQEDRLSGVFDWGCSVYGDHLYELAWFEFWAPWMPQLDVAYLRTALETHWQAIGYDPPHKAERLAACYLHIGLDHLAYNAYLGDWSTLLATAERMQTLVMPGFTS
ncbi:MAG: aminoglycoside phosphotransferase family protein [Caldilineaceae bacterium]|nr:aminoglycoside phosphotransferase family protein [Caldilineaceae bacterium]